MVDSPVTSARVKVELTSGGPNSGSLCEVRVHVQLGHILGSQCEGLVIRLRDCLAERMVVNITYREVLKKTPIPALDHVGPRRYPHRCLSAA